MKVLEFLKTLLIVYGLGCGASDGWNLHAANRSHIFCVNGGAVDIRKSLNEDKNVKKYMEKVGGVVAIVVVECCSGGGL